MLLPALIFLIGLSGTAANPPTTALVTPAEPFPTIEGWLKSGTKAYSIEVYSGLDLDILEVEAEIHRILLDRRGWNAAPNLKLVPFTKSQSAKSKSKRRPDLVIRVVTPWQADHMCSPLKVDSTLSCRNGGYVVINADRWKWAVPHWTASLAEYRAYVVNHEIGHFLGQGHQPCGDPAGDGSYPAHLMVQQSIGLEGCAPNGWPYPGNVVP
ncbi:MAG: DUF3152 domain-containing protein [Pseudomonadota bacterium]